MAKNPPAPSTKTAFTQARGAVSQAEMGGWPTSAQRGTKGAMVREEEKETGKESEDDEDKWGDEDEGIDNSSKWIKEETESPMKPPPEPEPQPKKHSKVNDNEGMEGMDDKENLFPYKVA